MKRSTLLLAGAPALVFLLVFLEGRSAAADLRHVAIVGETAPGTGGATYTHFGVLLVEPFLDVVAPAVNASGGVAFVAGVAGGTTTQGIFLDVDGADSAVALRGQGAQGTGGGVFDEHRASTRPAPSPSRRT